MQVMVQHALFVQETCFTNDQIGDTKLKPETVLFIYFLFRSLDVFDGNHESDLNYYMIEF
jgi:hypothetical protein